MTEKEFQSTSMYSNSKLCSLLYGRRLASEFEKESKPVVVNLLSPGLVFTNVTRYESFRWIKIALCFLPLGWWTKTSRQGAQTVLQVAMNSTKEQNGKWFNNCKPGTYASIADRPDWANKVWELTNRLLPFPVRVGKDSWTTSCGVLLVIVTLLLLEKCSYNKRKSIELVSLSLSLKTWQSMNCVVYTRVQQKKRVSLPEKLLPNKFHFLKENLIEMN